MALQMQYLVDQALDAMQSGNYDRALRLWNRARNQMDLPILRIHAAICHLRLDRPDLSVAVLGPLLPQGSRPDSYPEPTVDQRILFTLDSQDPAMTMAWAVASQSWHHLKRGDAARHCLKEGLELWKTQQSYPDHSFQRSQTCAAVQELMTAAGCLGDHVGVYRLFRQTESPNGCILMLAAISLFNHGLYQEAIRLWNLLDSSASEPLVTTAEWLQKGLVPPFTLEYDFPWHRWAATDTSEGCEGSYETLIQYPLPGHVRIQLIFRSLSSTIAPHENWDSLTLLLREASPWSEQFALQALANPWFEPHLRPRILQLLLDKEMIALNSEVLWWSHGRVLRTTPEQLGCLDSRQCRALTNQALELLLKGRENEALPLLEKAYRWRPGDELIGLAMAECLCLLGQWHRARALLVSLGRYWYDDLEFHRDAALVASCLQDYNLHRHHMYSLRALRQGLPALPPL